MRAAHRLRGKNADRHVAAVSHAGLEKIDRVDGKQRLAVFFRLRAQLLDGGADVKKTISLSVSSAPVREHPRGKRLPVERAVRQKHIAERFLQRGFQRRVGFQKLVIQRVAVDDDPARARQFPAETSSCRSRWDR